MKVKEKKKLKTRIKKKKKEENEEEEREKTTVNLLREPAKAKEDVPMGRKGGKEKDGEGIATESNEIVKDLSVRDGCSPMDWEAAGGEELELSTTEF